MSVIDVTSLTKDYGSGRGVFDVTFHVNEGEVFGFLGPNGAGKSTTIRHLLGFSKPDKGSTKIFGKETFSCYPEILGKVGYIPGEIALPAGLTGWEFLHMMQNLQGKHDNERLQSLLKLFELDPEGETKRMSLGVKRKLAVVTAFMNDPEVLILDEPTSGLDPVMQDVFIEYVKAEKARGKTVLLSSHIFSEVDATCDRIAIIKDGRIVSDFIANDLKHSSQKAYEATFADDNGYQSFYWQFQADPLVQFANCSQEEHKILFVSEDKHINSVIDALSKHRIVDFRQRKETLEDYFMSYYKEEKDFKGALK